jgi:hypothetical protein
MQETLHSYTPEANFSPIVTVSQLNGPVDGWKETGWFLKRKEDELAGHIFDSEVFREGSD